MPYKDPEIRREKQKEYQRRFYQKNKQYYADKKKEQLKTAKRFVEDYKRNHPCEHCGESDIRCLQFHHKDPTQKDNTICNAARLGWSNKRIKKEIDKCIVLCANCHAKIHYIGE